MDPVGRRTSHTLPDPSVESWLRAGGEMGRSVQAFDWAGTALGPIASWPQSLRLALGICLSSRFPMFLWWGPDLINFYNDAYIPVLGKRHPGALGRGARDVWHDVWPSIAGQIEAVFERGEASWHERLRLVTDRNGYEEKGYFTYSHSPVFDESGKVGGVVCVVSEETNRVFAELRQAFLLDLSDRLRVLTGPQAITDAAVDALGRHLGANRAGYGEVQADGETIVLESSYVDGVVPLKGPFPLLGFGGENIARQRRGVTVVHEDVADDPANNLEMWESIDTRSFVSVPLLRDGRLRASLYVNFRNPHRWPLEEVTFIEDVASRTWEALERARAEREFRHSERRQTLLLRLMQERRKTANPEAMMRAAAEAVGGHLNTDRAGFFEMRDGHTLEFSARGTAANSPPRTGAFPAAGIGPRYLAEMRAGHTLGITDTKTDPLTADSSFSETGAVSMIAAPIIRNGRWHAGLYVSHGEPRVWTPGEISLVRDVAEQTWEAIERARAEEARHKSEERLSFALQAAGGVGAWDCDVRTDRLYCSPRFAQMFSVDPERAAQGAPIAEYLAAVHPDDRARVTGQVQRAIEQGGDYLAEYRVVLKDGSVRWLYALGRGHLDEAGNPGRFTGVVFDITERKLAELRNTFLVRLDDAVRPLTDPQEITQMAAHLLAEHLKVNRCAYADVEADQDTFNLTGDYNIGVASIVGRYRFTQFGEECLRLMRKGEPYVVEDSETDARTEEVRESYRLTSIRAVICVPLHKQGRFAAGMAVHQITPRKWRTDEVELVQQVMDRCWESIERARVARALEEEERRYRFLADSIPQMVWTATPDGVLNYASRQALWYFGTGLEEILGDRWLQWVHLEDAERTVERWKNSLRTMEPYEAAFRLLRASDSSWRWHLVRAIPLIGDGGMAVQWFGTCTDIEDQKAIEAELTRANRELEEFAYVSSHDLQEPLRMVNIYTQLLLRKFIPDDPDAKLYAGFVHQGVQRMQQLIQDLLSYSRTVHVDEDQPAGTAGTSRSLADAVGVLKNRIEEAGAVISAGPLPVVRGDSGQISLVFQNLLTNSLKYRRKDAAPEIDVSAERSGGEWVIAVRDNGIGFEQEYAERIFGLFKRLHKDAYPGTGLGLAICQRIVERYGGRIWAEGRPGEGATFYFALPGAEAE